MKDNLLFLADFAKKHYEYGALILALFAVFALTIFQIVAKV